MLRSLLIIILIVFRFSGCSTAYAEESLNLELLCDGIIELKLKDPGKAENYKSIDKLLGENLLSQLGVTKKFSEQITVKDNMIGKARVKPTATEIILSEEYVSQLYDKTGVKVAAQIDRLTGKFKVNAMISNQEREEFKLFSALGLIGFQSTGICTKLAPKKKLF